MLLYMDSKYLGNYEIIPMSHRIGIDLSINANKQTFYHAP